MGIKAWITVNGNHIPIMDGESKMAAVSRFIKSKREKMWSKKYKELQDADPDNDARARHGRAHIETTDRYMKSKGPTIKGRAKTGLEKANDAEEAVYRKLNPRIEKAKAEGATAKQIAARERYRDNKAYLEWQYAYEDPKRYKLKAKSSNKVNFKTSTKNLHDVEIKSTRQGYLLTIKSKDGKDNDFVGDYRTLDDIKKDLSWLGISKKKFDTDLRRNR